MLLYILAAQPLNDAIMNDPLISGFKLNMAEIQLLQYADDNTVILKDIPSYKRIMIHFSTFEKASGSHLNKDKTEILSFGSKNNIVDLSQYIKEESTILGVKFNKKGLI